MRASVQARARECEFVRAARARGSLRSSIRGAVERWVGGARTLTALTVAVSGSVTRCVARAMGAVIERWTPAAAAASAARWSGALSLRRPLAVQTTGT